MNNLKIAYFGGEPIGIPVLKILTERGITPSLVVTTPDRPQGRGLTLSFPPLKTWAHEHGLSVFQPETLSDANTLHTITSQEWDLFIVVSYGFIMPKWLVDFPKHGTLNVHPSLLPKLRGASPIRTSILQNYADCGVTIMKMDEKMDHGPILIQEPYTPKTPIAGRELDALLAHRGGELLSLVIPKYILGEITLQEQNHSEATFSKKITKEMGELSINPLSLPTGKEAHELYLKICAYDGWPGTFFFHNGKRIKILEAQYVDDTLVLLLVVPEGKKPISFSQYVQSIS